LPRVAAAIGPTAAAVLPELCTSAIERSAVRARIIDNARAQIATARVGAARRIAAGLGGVVAATAERYGQLFHRLYGVPVVSLRYFNVFGPRQAFDSPYSGVIAKFCTGFLRNETPVIFGDGLQSRDFTHIRNVISANLLAIDSPAERVAGGVFNAACGESISLLRLVSDLNRLTGRTLQPRFEPERVGDVKHSRADIGSARERLGYTPLVDWETGLAETLDWYRSQK
jgi:UDP-glucose 4-epimerase